MGVGRIIFQGVAKRVISVGAAVVKFHFSNSNLRKKTFFTKTLTEKYQISKSKGVKTPPCHPLPTPMIMTPINCLMTFLFQCVCLCLLWFAGDW